MARLSARVPTRAPAGTSHTQSARPGNGGLIGLLAVTVWVRIVFSTVDFDGLMAPRRGGMAETAAEGLEPNPVTRALKIAMILIGALVIFAHMRETRALMKRVNVFFLGFLLLALMSVTWSFDQSATLN